jgi:hypothetical protein
MYPFRLPHSTHLASNQPSAAVAMRRLRDTLPIDRARAAMDRDEPAALLRHLLQEEPQPQDGRSA